MKNFLYFIIIVAIVLCHAPLFAQNINDSSLPKKPDTGKIIVEKSVSPTQKNIADTVKKQIRQKAISLEDTTKTDTINNKKKSRDIARQNISLQKQVEKPGLDKPGKPDTIAVSGSEPSKPGYFDTNELLLKNRIINVRESPVFSIEAVRHPVGKEFLFYSLCIIVLILGLFKTIYNSYFNNLFRVYFNTSLRQTQLADQLLQAKLPSFILNIFFAFSVGMYIWLLFGLYHPPRLISSKLLLPFCILSVALLYFIKFCLLKFMGWIADISQATDNYIFAIFLVNKITGIFLIPIIILLAFLKREWVPIVANLSFMVLLLFFISRYIKSYGAIEKKMPLNPFHFIIYIAGGEIIPLIIIYKVAIDYLI